MQAFVHLHVHSAFSLLEGALPLERLIELTVKDEQPAIAVTDRDNLFGALEFSQKAIAKGVQPIIGCTLQVEFEPGENPAENTYAQEKKPSLVFLCANETGYGNLMRLASMAHLEGGREASPHIGLADLEKYHQGLIALSGGAFGPLDEGLRDNQPDKAEARLKKLKEILGDRFYIEIQRHGIEPKRMEKELLELAYGNGVPIVATNEAYFAAREDFEAHDALICIAESRVLVEEDRRRLSHEHYLKSAKEMVELFADLPEAIENTIEIARRCAFCVSEREPILPSFIEGSDKDGKAEAQELRKQAQAGLKERLSANEPAEGFGKKEYEERLEFELSVIEKMNYPGYFLIVADFVRWAKEQDIAVGPGRGSGAGSLVAWALTITDLDPMRFSLLFERFLNPERISMPDFDIDFCQDRRDEVIRYVREKYGNGQVAQIITFGTLQARAVLRDVGRVLQMPYPQVDRLCKMVPNNPANPVTLAEAIDAEPALQAERDNEPIVKRLMTIALKLEGLYRHASTHAAGIVIADRELDRLVPLYRDARSDMPVTQFNMKWAEKAGLVKFDFLGLKTLTVIRKTLQYLEERGVSVNMETLALDDEKTYEMMQSGETVGIFQLESTGMRKALVGMKPDRFEDIIALVALYRPGPMENIPLYNSRKHGHEKAEYYHEKIKSVLTETYGVIIYQEQVMEIARILSGYSLGEADMLRRAMGKKIRKEMEEQRKRFIEGARERDLSASQAESIFDVLAKFADYGFNKSHAAAYALISYQTAWLKANHPIEFLAALMSLDKGNTDKLHDFYREGKRAGIEVKAPCVNESQVDFTIKGEIVHYALAAVKGAGAQAMEHIVQTREEGGAFRSVADFFSRIDARKVNRKMLENLVQAGAFDCFGNPREQLIHNLDMLINHANRVLENSQAGIEDMFGGGEETASLQMPEADTWQVSKRLLKESESLGFYLSAHPLDECVSMLAERRVKLWAEFSERMKRDGQAGSAKLAGTVMSFKEIRTKNGKRMGRVQLSDPTGQFEGVLFAETLAKHRDELKEGESVIMRVEAEERPEGLSLRIQSVAPLHEELAQSAQSAHRKRELKIFVREETALPHLTKILTGNSRSGRDGNGSGNGQNGQSGTGKVSIIVLKPKGEGEIEIDLNRKYALSAEIAGAIKAMAGIEEVQLT